MSDQDNSGGQNIDEKTHYAPIRRNDEPGPLEKYSVDIEYHRTTDLRRWHVDVKANCHSEASTHALTVLRDIERKMGFEITLQRTLVDMQVASMGGWQQVHTINKAEADESGNIQIPAAKPMKKKCPEESVKNELLRCTQNERDRTLAVMLYEDNVNIQGVLERYNNLVRLGGSKANKKPFIAPIDHSAAQYLGKT